MRKSKLTKEIKDYILENYKTTSNKDLANQITEKFNVPVKNGDIANFKIRYKKETGISLSNGINQGRFPKGHIPLNKGTKGLFNVGGNSGSFKKGNIPKNHRPVGSERRTKDGYIEIKVKEPNKWRIKSRKVYEEYHGIKLNKSDIIIYLDQNKLNLDPSNLKLITQPEHVIINRDIGRTDNIEITEASIKLAKLQIKQTDLQKKNNP